MPGRIFTVKTALSDYFQGALGETKLRELLRSGDIHHTRAGAKILIREETLDNWMAMQEQKSAQRDLPLRVVR
jgi:excisionase family DNA binding protein